MPTAPTEASVWLTNLVLGAAALLPPRLESTLVSKGQVRSPTDNAYKLFVGQDGKPLASTDRYTLYVCLSPEGQYVSMKIAKSPDFNANLATEADVLETMGQEAVRLDREALVSGDKPYNYQLFFPLLVESFISPDNRQVNILGYPEVIKTLKQLTPLSQMVAGRQRVDVKTIVWILGKSLKVLGFAHDQGISNGLIIPSNILIEPEIHGVMVFDWSKATRYDELVPMEAARAEIVQLAQCVVSILGNTDPLRLPHDTHLLTTDQHRQFTAYLQRLLEGSVGDALEAHRQLYALSDQIWPRKEVTPGKLARDFHPYTTYSI